MSKRTTGLLTGTKVRVLGTNKFLISTFYYDEKGHLIQTLKDNIKDGTDVTSYQYHFDERLLSVDTKHTNLSGGYNHFGILTKLLFGKIGRTTGGFDNQDYTFAGNQLDGHVAGQLWNSKGDNVQRKYDYTYDNPGRISGADFTQNAGSGWGNGTVDFSISNLGYDLNGNITHINRRGLKSGTSATIDQLSYTYLANSNRLMKVVDGIGGTSTALGDFHNGTNSGNDYGYDSNGNLIEDLNKGTSSITYNYLNLPTQINFTGKGNVKLIYDAGGNKLQKIITDNTTAPARTITTDYLHGFVYKNDTLQYLATEEGHMRPLSPSGNATGGFTYDYFVRDHLGDVRMVLTEQTDRSQYIATMEPNRAQLEDALFYNVNSTRALKPAGYPQDDITTPNTAIARLNGADPDKRIGPSIILKVMAGDTIQTAVRSFYKLQNPPSPKTTVPAEQVLAGLLRAFTAP